MRTKFRAAPVPCTCVQCGSIFEIQPSDVNRGRGRFCTTKCWYAFSRARPLADRIWPRGTWAGQCLEWTGALTPTGYGKIGIDGHTVPVHRVAWELTYGPIPAGLWVLHHCDNRKCFLPEHLFLGTPLDNMTDMHAKGRNRNPRIYSDDDIRTMRERYAAGTPQAEIVRDYGLSSGYLSAILRGKGRPTHA